MDSKILYYAYQDSLPLLIKMKSSNPENLEKFLTSLNDEQIEELKDCISSAIYVSPPTHAKMRAKDIDPVMFEINKNFNMQDLEYMKSYVMDEFKKREPRIQTKRRQYPDPFMQGGTVGLRIGPNKKTIFKINKPGIVDGRTCYQVGPLKWCNRKKTKTKTGGKKYRRTRKNYKK